MSIPRNSHRYLRYLFSCKPVPLSNSAEATVRRSGSRKFILNLFSEVKGSNPKPMLRFFCSPVQDPVNSKELKNENEHEEEPHGNHSEEEKEDEEGGEYVNSETGERGGPRGPEPTRYGDWEKGGRCSDF
uniref:Succinate dehydrogenase assembly factor 4, mitochondrial n=1 Tax=Picea sitchensis TaxID=3332 RepID=A9NWI2_PICSI|nr:unknown [Picea sitchensis]